MKKFLLFAAAALMGNSFAAAQSFSDIFSMSLSEGGAEVVDGSRLGVHENDAYYECYVKIANKTEDFHSVSIVLGAVSPALAEIEDNPVDYGNPSLCYSMPSDDGKLTGNCWMGVKGANLGVGSIKFDPSDGIKNWAELQFHILTFIEQKLPASYRVDVVLLDEDDNETDTRFHYFIDLFQDSAVEAVDADAAAPVRYFDLQGRSVAEPSRGLYIVKQGAEVSKKLFK